MGSKIIEAVSNTRIDTSKAIVSRAKEYVVENYTQEEINVESVSAYLHYSPNYFSSVFKKETGIAFMKFLLDLRIEKAKDLLLATNMKNFEIALEVGFSSANYFSFCFKKEVGLSPSQYKKQEKK
jgi:two-component system response regulator YesN